MFRHGELAEGLIARFEAPAARALNNVESQNARCLAMMVENGELARIGAPTRYSTPLGNTVIADGLHLAQQRCIDSDRGASAFLNDPKPFIAGAKDLMSSAGEHVGGPIARSINWTLVVLIGMGIALIVWAARVFPGICWRAVAKRNSENQG